MWTAGPRSACVGPPADSDGAALEAWTRSRPRDGERCGRWWGRGSGTGLSPFAGTASGELCANVSGVGGISRVPVSQLATIPLGPEAATECGEDRGRLSQ